MLRKIAPLLTFLTILSGTLYSQCVQQGTNIIGLDIKLGIYNTTTVDKGNNNYVHYDRAGDIGYIFSFEHGMNDNFTLGGELRYNSFLLAKDTTGNQINQAYGIDVCVDGAFHFVRSEHTDLYVGGALGYAYIKLANTNINNQGVYTASGVAYNLDLGGRFYLGDHFGIHLEFGYAGYYYPNGTVIGGGGYTDHFSFFFSGSTYDIGFCYKL